VSLLSVLVLAVAVAVLGTGVGLAARNRSRLQVEVLVHLATGALLGITAFDILPEAKAVLPWPIFLGSALGGYALLWLIGRFVYSVCPSCSIADFEESALIRYGSLALLATALGVHCLMDGLAISTGQLLSAKAEIGAIFAVCLHKFPEGLALGFVLAAAGFRSVPSLLFSAGVESLTIVGGLAGLLISAHPTTGTIGVVFAVVGGSFIYLVLNAMKGAASHRAQLRKSRTILIEAMSFSFVGLLFYFIAHA